MASDKALAAAEKLALGGRMAEACEALSRALRRSPKNAGLYAARAEVQFQRRLFSESLADFDRAVALRPRDAMLLSARAELLSALDRLDEAARDLSRAARLDPGEPGLALAGAKLLIRAGKLEEAARAARAIGRRGPEAAREARFLEGCIALKAGRPVPAGELFRRAAAGAPPESAFAQRCLFYRLAADALALRPPRPRPPGQGPELSICGVGLFPPYTVTAEVLQAAAEADVVVCNVSGEETRELMGVICRHVLPGGYQGRDSADWIRLFGSLLLQGKSAAFVTRGNPFVFGGLATDMLEMARSMGYRSRTYGAVSSLDVMPLQLARGAGMAIDGVQVFQPDSLRETKAVDRARALLVFSTVDLEREAVEDLSRSLLRLYEPGRLVLLFGPQYDAEPAAFPLRELRARLPRMDASLVVLVAPR